MPGSGTDANRLIECAAAGDANAFGCLYEQHLEAIYRYVYFRVDNSADAEDLTEHVFLKAWEALPDYKNQGYPFSSWLYRIAHNIVIDHHRRNKYKVQMPPQEQITLMEWEAGGEPTSLDRLIEAEEANALAEAIAQLPEIQQEVIILRFIEGFDHDKIATILDKSNGACRTIQYRALAALNELLAGERVGVS